MISAGQITIKPSPPPPPPIGVSPQVKVYTPPPQPSKAASSSGTTTTAGSRETGNEGIRTKEDPGPRGTIEISPKKIIIKPGSRKIIVPAPKIHQLQTPQYDTPTAIVGLMSFFGENNAVVNHPISMQDVTLGRLIEGVSCRLVSSGFISYDDTFEYSGLIEKTLRKIPIVNRIIDLGAGSSLPTITALKTIFGDECINVVAVDRDPEANQVGLSNAKEAGYEGRYTFVTDDMSSFMESHHIEEGDLVVSNPPYLPWPQGMTGSLFVPVNGGPDGTLYLEQILSAPMPTGNYAAIRWSSLSNPAKVIGMISKSWEVAYLEVTKTPFGAYTSIIEGYLAKQREAGLAVYFRGADGQNYYYYISMILKKKDEGISAAPGLWRREEITAAPELHRVAGSPEEWVDQFDPYGVGADQWVESGGIYVMPLPMESTAIFVAP